jgi:hypothetical protein
VGRDRDRDRDDWDGADASSRVVIVAVERGGRDGTSGWACGGGEREHDQHLR